MQICFVGHEFHQTSRSHVFFLEILKSMGSVSEFYLDPDNNRAESSLELALRIRSSRFDHYVFWQTEEVASHFAMWGDSGCLTIVPMWDGAIGHDHHWWRRFETHQFIAFSRALHENLQQAGLRSAYFQYFPKLGQSAAQADPDSAFFWERRPNDQLNVARVFRQAQKLGIKHLHVHAVCDFARDRLTQSVRLASLDTASLSVSVSEWFDDKAEFEACVARHAFVFAPRAIEGIGMAVAEAMGRGQVVIAPDFSTMNEYIGQGSSGILYDPNDPFALKALSPDDKARIRKGALARASLGRDRWLADIERLKSVIMRDNRRWGATDFAADYVNLLKRNAYRRAVGSGAR